MPDVNKPFVLQMDASNRAIGAVIMQKDENEELPPCGYLSKALTPTQSNWQIYDRELFAIYYTCYDKHTLRADAPIPRTFSSLYCTVPLLYLCLTDTDTIIPLQLPPPVSPPV